MKKKKLLSKICLVVGLILLIVNILGSFISMRNPKIYQLGLKNKFGIQYSKEEVYSKIEKTMNQSLPDSSKITEICKIVNKGMAHYWNIKKANEFNLTVPFYENFLLNILSQLVPDRFSALKNKLQLYEFQFYKKGLERGVGLCSQHAIVLHGLLKENGFVSKLVKLDGHVLNTAKIDKGKWWILDADFGVVVPLGLPKIEKNPEVVIPYYKRVGITDSGLNRKLISLYQAEGNQICSEVKDLNPNKYAIEKITYLLKWLIPAIFCSFYFLNLLRKKTFKIS